MLLLLLQQRRNARWEGGLFERVNRCSVRLRLVAWCAGSYFRVRSARRTLRRRHQAHGTPVFAVQAGGGSGFAQIELISIAGAWLRDRRMNAQEPRAFFKPGQNFTVVYTKNENHWAQGANGQWVVSVLHLESGTTHQLAKVAGAFS